MTYPNTLVRCYLTWLLTSIFQNDLVGCVTNLFSKQILRLNVFLDKKRNKKLPCPGGLFRFNFIMLVDGANDDPAPDWLHMNGHRSFSQFGPRKSNREREREWERNKVIKTKWTSNWSLLDINQSWATHNGQAETIAKIILANVAVAMVGLTFTDSKKLLPRL